MFEDEGASAKDALPTSDFGAKALNSFWNLIEKASTLPVQSNASNSGGRSSIKFGPSGGPNVRSESRPPGNSGSASRSPLFAGRQSPSRKTYENSGFIKSAQIASSEPPHWKMPGSTNLSYAEGVVGTVDEGWGLNCSSESGLRQNVIGLSNNAMKQQPVDISIYRHKGAIVGSENAAWDPSLWPFDPEQAQQAQQERCGQSGKNQFNKKDASIYITQMENERGEFLRKEQKFNELLELKKLIDVQKDDDIEALRRNLAESEKARDELLVGMPPLAVSDNMQRRRKSGASYRSGDPSPMRSLPQQSGPSRNSSTGFCGTDDGILPRSIMADEEAVKSLRQRDSAIENYKRTVDMYKRQVSELLSEKNHVMSLYQNEKDSWKQVVAEKNEWICSLDRQLEVEIQCRQSGDAKLSRLTKEFKFRAETYEEKISALTQRLESAEKDIESKREEVDKLDVSIKKLQSYLSNTQMTCRVFEATQIVGPHLLIPVTLTIHHCRHTGFATLTVVRPSDHQVIDLSHVRRVEGVVLDFRTTTMTTATVMSKTAFDRQSTRNFFFTGNVDSGKSRDETKRSGWFNMFDFLSLTHSKSDNADDEPRKSIVASDHDQRYACMTSLRLTTDKGIIYIFDLKANDMMEECLRLLRTIAQEAARQSASEEQCLAVSCIGELESFFLGEEASLPASSTKKPMHSSLALANQAQTTQAAYHPNLNFYGAACMQMPHPSPHGLDAITIPPPQQQRAITALPEVPFNLQGLNTSTYSALHPDTPTQRIVGNLPAHNFSNFPNNFNYYSTSEARTLHSPRQPGAEQSNVQPYGELCSVNSGRENRIKTALLPDSRFNPMSDIIRDNFNVPTGASAKQRQGHSSMAKMSQIPMQSRNRSRQQFIDQHTDTDFSAPHRNAGDWPPLVGVHQSARGAMDPSSVQCTNLFHLLGRSEEKRKAFKNRKIEQVDSHMHDSVASTPPTAGRQRAGENQLFDPRWGIHNTGLSGGTGRHKLDEKRGHQQKFTTDKERLTQRQQIHNSRGNQGTCPVKGSNQSQSWYPLSERILRPKEQSRVQMGHMGSDRLRYTRNSPILSCEDDSGRDDEYFDEDAIHNSSSKQWCLPPFQPQHLTSEKDSVVKSRGDRRQKRDVISPSTKNKYGDNTSPSTQNKYGEFEDCVISMDEKSRLEKSLQNFGKVYPVEGHQSGKSHFVMAEQQLQHRAFDERLQSVDNRLQSVDNPNQAQEISRSGKFQKRSDNHFKNSNSLGMHPSSTRRQKKSHLSRKPNPENNYSGDEFSFASSAHQENDFYGPPPNGEGGRAADKRRHSNLLLQKKQQKESTQRRRSNVEKPNAKIENTSSGKINKLERPPAHRSKKNGDEEQQCFSSQESTKRRTALRVHIDRSEEVSPSPNTSSNRSHEHGSTVDRNRVEGGRKKRTRNFDSGKPFHYDDEGADVVIISKEEQGRQSMLHQRGSGSRLVKDHTDSKELAWGSNNRQQPGGEVVAFSAHYGDDSCRAAHSEAGKGTYEDGVDCGNQRNDSRSEIGCEGKRKFNSPVSLILGKQLFCDPKNSKSVEDHAEVPTGYESFPT